MWYFKPKTPGDTIREPVQSEFFATDAISDPGVALVREGIQNSLDAARPGEKVLVCIYLSGNGGALAPNAVSAYFEGAWDHLRAGENGLRADELPCPTDRCSFIAFEDFGTRGLQGNPAEPFRSRTGRKNHFYHFFRAEGQSDKDASQRGSWGVGKHVFPRSSRISTMFGVTVRADDRGRLLMGKTVLKSHYVGHDYCQDGYWGVPPGDGRELVMPIAERGPIDTFCQAFDLQRGGDPGLSLVVPWPDPAMTDRSIVLAVLRGYFFPVLSGQLEVMVETPTVKTVLDAASLPGEVARIGDLGQDIDIQPLLRLVRLADWARQLPPQEKASLEMPDPDRAWQWSEELFQPDLLAA